MRPRIAITVGDHNGIGPEVALKACMSKHVLRACSPILVGPEASFMKYAKRLRVKPAMRELDASLLENRKTIQSGHPLCLFIPSSSTSCEPSPGRISAQAGRIAAIALEAACALALHGRVEALVTAPVSKEAVRRAGYLFPGQTEFIRDMCGARDAAMILAAPSMKVALATIHVPLRLVPSVLTAGSLASRIRLTHEALKVDWGIRRPRIAVLGLNPHAGENGMLGKEEHTVIRPVIQQLRSRGIDLHGPFPADAFFGRMDFRAYDAIMAMYHDQGLIPLKLVAHGTAVNVTAGLPVVRTSPDHGTAFDIAGRNRADARSMIAAILLAARIARHRQSHQRSVLQ